MVDELQLRAQCRLKLADPWCTLPKKVSVTIVSERARSSFYLFEYVYFVLPRKEIMKHADM